MLKLNIKYYLLKDNNSYILNVKGIFLLNFYKIILFVNKNIIKEKKIK
jgi:hypothetical protein